MNLHTIATTVDARGLKCPEPLMQLYAALNKIAAGEIVKFHANDPASLRDVEQLCKHLNHTIANRQHEEDGAFIIHIQKRSS